MLCGQNPKFVPFLSTHGHDDQEDSGTAIYGTALYSGVHNRTQSRWVGAMMHVGSGPLLEKTSVRSIVSTFDVLLRYFDVSLEIYDVLSTRHYVW